MRPWASPWPSSIPMCREYLTLSAAVCTMRKKGCSGSPVVKMSRRFSLTPRLICSSKPWRGDGKAGGRDYHVPNREQRGASVSMSGPSEFMISTTVGTGSATCCRIFTGDSLAHDAAHVRPSGEAAATPRFSDGSRSRYYLFGGPSHLYGGRDHVGWSGQRAGPIREDPSLPRARPPSR